MSRAKASGYVLKRADAPIIMGMIARGDRDHDIAAWFGVNQGRIADVKDGSKFGFVAAAPANQLPPKGPPGIKGRRLSWTLANFRCSGSGDIAAISNPGGIFTRSRVCPGPCENSHLPHIPGHSAHPPLQKLAKVQLREAAETALESLNEGDQESAVIYLRGAIAAYDKNER